MAGSSRVAAMAAAFALLAASCGGDDGGSVPAGTTVNGRPVIATLLAADPVVEPADGNRYTNPGAVVVHDGRYHMLRNSFQDWPGPSVVSHLISDDGITWSEPSPKPVFTSSQVPYTQGNAFFMSAHVGDGGTWVAYLYTYDGKTNPGFIGRATAPGPGGPWAVDPKPVLSPGPEGSWDAARVIEPSVIRSADGYVMFYSGIDADGTGRIGRATSTDGITWSKHGQAVLEGTAEWTGDSIGCPQAVLTDTGLLMTFDAVDARFKIGTATSADGISWTQSEEPIVELANSPGRLPIWQSELVARDGTLRWWLEAGPGASATDIYAYRLDVDAAEQRMEATADIGEDGSVTINVRATGFTIGFDANDTSGATAHVHAFIDRPPPAAGGDVPLDEKTIIHSKEARFVVRDLTSGKHTIWIVAADGKDRALIPPRPLRLDVTIP